MCGEVGASSSSFSLDDAFSTSTLDLIFDFWENTFLGQGFGEACLGEDLTPSSSFEDNTSLTTKNGFFLVSLWVSLCLSWTS